MLSKPCLCFITGTWSLPSHCGTDSDEKIKTAVALCAGVCVVVLVLRLIVYLVGFETGRIITAVFLLLPFPFFVFFLAGTLKALSTAIKVAADEKRRIVAVLVVVLLIYTLLFLPIIVFCLVKEARDNINFSNAALIVVLLILLQIQLYIYYLEKVP